MRTENAFLQQVIMQLQEHNQEAQEWQEDFAVKIVEEINNGN